MRMVAIVVAHWATMVLLKGNNMKAKYLLPLALIIFSCSNDPVNGVDDFLYEEYEKVIMKMPIDEVDSDVQTKNEAIIGSSVSYVWSESDVVGIFPDTGSQLYFTIPSDKAGEKEIIFDGGGWALRKGSSYFSYFPFVPDFYIDKTAIPMSLVGQRQKGNADPGRAVLGNYCYAVANGTSDAAGNLMFDYKKLVILHRLRIPVDAGTYTSLTVRAPEKVIAESGTFNALQFDPDSPEIDNPVYTDTITLMFEDLTMTTPGTLVAFIMLPPFNLEGKQLSFELQKEDGTICHASTYGVDFKLGNVYARSLDLSVYLSPSELPSAGGTVNLNVVTADENCSYVFMDIPSWLKIAPSAVAGSYEYTVTAEKNTGAPRKGTFSVAKTAKNGDVLYNYVTVTQYADGLGVDVLDWEYDGKDYGGDAK